jgi:alpha-ketoglutarate-dependent 2,4-dichlorophenoxyacetate dioxygenase
MAAAVAVNTIQVPLTDKVVGETSQPALTYRPLHRTFGAEVTGADFGDVSSYPKLCEQVKEGLAKYGVLVFRKTGLDDDRHVAFSHLFGELDDITPFVAGLGQKNRLSSDYLFDVGNVNPDGTVTQTDTKRAALLRCNYHFHADSAFNPRRAGYSLLLAHHLPPPGTGGATEFADTRQAYDDLDDATKERIADYVVMNSQHQCRRAANPGNPMLDGAEHDPMQNRFGKHKLVQLHEPSGRMNLYIAAHAHHVEGQDIEGGHKELLELLEYAGRPEYTFQVDWKEPGDLVVWDNTCVLHRSVRGTYEGKYLRDLRRTTVHDMSSQAWGLNEVGATWRSGLP